MSAPAVKAFLSYSHDSKSHKERVLKLADRLRRDGIDVSLDQYEGTPPEGWPHWMERQFRAADHVLMVCTETYLRRIERREEPGRGKGVLWEGNLIYQELYTEGSLNRRFIPITFKDTDEYIPLPLRGATRYVLSRKKGYEELRCRLLGQEAAVPPPVGSLAPSSQALEEALTAYKSERMEDPDIRQLDLRALARISRGAHETELHLLDVAVAPSVCAEPKEDCRRETALWNRLRARDLEPAERQKLQQELERLERARWEYHQGRRTPVGEPIPFAQALHRHRGLMVIGEPGAGKSVLTRLAFLACDEGQAGVKARELLRDGRWYFPDVYTTVEALQGLLPIHLTLGGMGRTLAKQELSIEEFLHRQLRERKAPHALRAGLAQLLEEGRIFLLCDGLDEAAEQQRWRVVDKVSEFVQRYPKARLLMTSRPHGSHPRVRGIARARLAPLHERTRRTLVRRLHYQLEARHRGDARGVERARRRTNALLHDIETRPEWAELSSNPLLLTLSALSPTDDQDAPRHRVFVFWNFIQTLSGEWRSHLSISQDKARRLITVWSDIASQLLLEDETHGATRERFLLLLAEALGKKGRFSTPDAETALHLALETGLVRQMEDETIAFWHKTFAEFLTACALTDRGSGTARKLLAQPRLPVQVLRLAAARLYHVATLHAEVDELAEGLLRRDAKGPQQLLRPGLRAASTCLAEGVCFSRELTERVWSSWAEVLERTPPSPLWKDFAQLTEYALPQKLPATLVERFAMIPDRGLQEAQDALARLVAPGAATIPAARAACQRWLQHAPSSTAKRHGAFGLALAGEWSEEVIDALGRFGATNALAPGSVGALVRQGGAPLRERLQMIVRARPPEPADRAQEKEEEVLGQRRLSAACLLAVSQGWDGDVARVMALALEERQSSFWEYGVTRALRACVREEAVQRSLLEWMVDGSALGARIREFVRDVAPAIESLPEQVLERAVQAEDRIRTDLESLLIEVGEEQRGFINVLERRLGDEREEVSLCAARLLLRLEPQSARLREAMRREMRSQDGLSRARWAKHSFGLDPALDDVALETLLDCARSPDSAVRKLVYDALPNLMHYLGWGSLHRWVACAKDPQLSAAARFDAIRLVEWSPEGKRLAPPLMRPLLHAGDAQVRRKAVFWLARREELDAESVAILAEEAARAEDDERFSILAFRRVELPAPTLVEAILRGIPDELPPAASEKLLQWSSWSSLLEGFAATNRACVEQLLDALKRRGPVVQLVDGVLRILGEKNVIVRDTLRERLEHTGAETSQRELLRLVLLGLRFEETMPAAVVASRKLKLEGLSQRTLEWLAEDLHDAQATGDAARLWRRVVEGEDLDLVLSAAEALVVRFPEEVGEWLPPVLERLLGSSNPAHRVDAARIALRCGMLEERALTVLLDCLELADQEYKREFGFRWLGRSRDWHALVSGPAGDLPLQKELMSQSPWAQIDFEAMQALCGYRPDIALTRLRAWLESTHPEHLRCAAAIFAERDRDALREALWKQLGSVPSRRLQWVVDLVDQHGLYSPDMAEQLLARYTADLPPHDDIELCLVECWRRHPDFWSVLRAQPPQRRAEVERLLQFGGPDGREAVAFLVEFTLAAPDALERRRWIFHFENCFRSRDTLKAERESVPEEEGTPTPAIMRGWLREVLAEQPPPTDLGRILLFDRFAEMGEVPPAQRIEALRRALDIDIFAGRDIQALGSEEELEKVTARRLCQAEAALLIHELKGHDERIPPLLELAVTAHAEPFISDWLGAACWRSLLALRPADTELRHRFTRAVVASEGFMTFNSLLELLSEAGLSETQRVDVLTSYLGIGSRPAWMETLAIRPLSDEHRRAKADRFFDAIEELGCTPERRLALLREFISTYEQELPTRTKLALAKRDDLPAPDAAKLLLSLIASPGRNSEAEKQWIERFGPPRSGPLEEERWTYADSEDLSLRQRSLERLSQVKDPALVESVLVELAKVPAARVLPLYRRARADDDLSDAEWSELLGLLATRTDDDRPALLAKEWLTLWLRQALESSTGDEGRWLSSAG
jgi:hypothetical protein